MSTLDSRQRDPLHRGVCGRRGEATLERFPQARQLAVAQTTRAAMPPRPERFETALLVVATELPEPLGGEAERFREPSEVALRVFGELNEDRVALELLVLLEGADQGTADEDLRARAPHHDAPSRREPVRNRESCSTRELERLRTCHRVAHDDTCNVPLTALCVTCNLRTDVARGRGRISRNRT